MTTSNHPRTGPTSRASRPAIAGKRVVGDKREAIVAAALELFVERGFYGTAVPEIADRAGVGAGTIYRYFESKEALVNVIYRQEKLHFAHVVLDDFPPAAPTREQFRLLWTRMAKFATEHTSSFVFLELHHHARYLDQESRAVENRMTDLFTTVVTRAQAKGDLKVGAPRLLMGLVMGAFVGVIRSCVEHDVEQQAQGATASRDSLPASSAAEGRRGAIGEADWKLAEQCVWEAIRG